VRVFGTLYGAGDRELLVQAVKAFSPLREDISALSGQTCDAITLWGPRTKRDIC
jgi:hypothetical protein